MNFRGLRFVWIIGILAAASTPLHADPVAPAARPRKVYAHYMGCFPAGSGPLDYARYQEAPKLRHDSANEVSRFGGHIRNWDLVPFNVHLTAEQSADLEIRRAVRIGIDGFAIDAWAGSDSAKATLNALFKVAEEKDYPFEITICVDPNCLGKETAVTAIQYLLEKHGKSPKLARRDGKPLIFGYQSVWLGIGYGMSKFGAKPEWKGKEGQIPNSVELRATPEGWTYLGEAMQDLQKQVGQPLYIHYCMSAFDYGVDRKDLTQEMLPKAAAIIAKHVGAVGSFGWLGPKQDEIGKAVLAAGAEWSCPVGMYEKENVPYECYMPPGTNWVSECWERAITGRATLLQLITWNDYGENTNIAPGYNSRYSLYDLTGYYVKWWKTGAAPIPDHDYVYLNYHKYPADSPVFPFKVKFADVKEGALEVVTILPRPATIRLPGRQIQYESPAGFFRKQFPLTPGQVSAELVRDGKVALQLKSPEPITDKPFREDHGLVCYSTEFMRHWKSDFGNAPPLLYSEYGDNGHGLPNWFAQYWYGKFLDFSPGADVDAKARGANGMTNLESWESQIDPTASLPAVPGHVTPVQR